MSSTRTISVTEFKAKCLDILDQLADRHMSQVGVTKRGRVAAILQPPGQDQAAIRDLHGFLRGSVVLPPAVDPTMPALPEPLLAEGGGTHA